jgi:pyridoxine 4-dehydrogenase
MRSHFTRFKEEHFKSNWGIVEGLQSVAGKKGVTPAQLSIAWVASLGPHMLPLPGSSYVQLHCKFDISYLMVFSRKSSRTLENLQAGDIELTAEEVKAINDILAANPVVGDRYAGAPPEKSHLWG